MLADAAAHEARGYREVFRATVPTGGTVVYLESGLEDAGLLELIHDVTTPGVETDRLQDTVSTTVKLRQARSRSMGCGKLVALDALFADNATWTTPGASSAAGTTRVKDAVFAAVRRTRSGRTRTDAGPDDGWARLSSSVFDKSENGLDRVIVDIESPRVVLQVPGRTLPAPGLFEARGLPETGGDGRLWIEHQTVAVIDLQLEGIVPGRQLWTQDTEGNAQPSLASAFDIAELCNGVDWERARILGTGCVSAIGSQPMTFHTDR